MAIVGAVYDAPLYLRTPEQVWRVLFKRPALAANDDTLAPRPSPIAQAVRASLSVAGSPTSRRGCGRTMRTRTLDLRAMNSKEQFALGDFNHILMTT